MDAVKRIIGSRRALERRVAELEKEVQECRQLNVRIAELCDVVTELLLPLEERDPASAREVLDRYRLDVMSPTANTNEG